MVNGDITILGDTKGCIGRPESAIPEFDKRQYKLSIACFKNLPHISGAVHDLGSYYFIPCFSDKPQNFFRIGGKK